MSYIGAPLGGSLGTYSKVYIHVPIPGPIHTSIRYLCIPSVVAALVIVVLTTSYLPTYLGISINRVDAVYLLSKAFMHTYCYSFCS